MTKFMDPDIFDSLFSPEDSKEMKRLFFERIMVIQENYSKAYKENPYLDTSGEFQNFFCHNKSMLRIDLYVEFTKQYPGIVGIKIINHKKYDTFSAFIADLYLANEPLN